MNNTKCTAKVVWALYASTSYTISPRTTFAAIYVELTLNMSAQTIVSCESPSKLVVF